jgi:uncharacterized protein
VKRTFLLLVVLLIPGAPLAAQEPYAPAHLAAAEELMEATRMREVMETSMDAMLEVQIQNAPELQELEPVMREFFERFISWDIVRPQYARMYAARFTESELREITAFYRTPVGRKLAAATPALTQEGARMGERMVQENIGELQRMIMEHMASAGM